MAHSRNLVGLFLLLATTIVQAQTTDYTKIPQLQTSATYTTEVTPDKFTLSIILSESNTRGRVSVEELENRMKTVLTNNNVDINKQLTISDLSSNFQDYFLKKTDIQKAKVYQLELYKAVNAGKILKDLEKQEISNVRLLKTEYSKMEELKIELKGKAVQKARRQAEEMVKGLDQKIGPALFISDLTTGVSRNLQNLRTTNTFYTELRESTKLDVDFNTIKVDATVTVFFQLVQ